jgi:hypothetical protein
MKAMLKNTPNSLISSNDSLKIASFNNYQPNMKAQSTNQAGQAVNPFEMVLPKVSDIFDSTHSHNSNRSLKGSNAFERRNFNFSSNRSEASVNLEDSQCDNPTPSFNQVMEDDANEYFRPRDSSLNEGIVHRPNLKSQNYIMKESATIMPVRNKSIVF